MKKALALLLALAMALTLVACGGAPASSTPASGSASVPASSTGAAEGDAEYAVVLKVLSSQYWQTMRDGIEAKAEELGIKVDIYAANTEDDVEGQVSLLENAISKGYKAIGVAPISNVSLNNAIAEATEKGGGFNGTGRTCFFGATGQGCPGVLPPAGELPLWGRHKGKDGRPSGFASAGAGRRPRRKGKGAFGWARRDKKKKPGLCACAPRRHVPGVCAGPAGSAVHRGFYCVEKRRAAARA